MVQIFGQQLPLLSHVEQLEIFQYFQENMEWTDNPDLDSSLWLEFFHLFIAAQSLRLSEKLVPPSPPLCKSSQARGPRKCCLRCAAFSWMDLSHLDLCQKALSHSLPLDSYLITP